MPVRSLVLILFAALIATARPTRADGVDAVGRVRPTAPGPTVSLAATSGYGFTESVLAGSDRHHRAQGALAIAVQAMPWLELSGKVVGRYDRHTGAGADDGLVGDPQLTVTAARHGATGSFGVRLGLWLPGADAPSIEPAATTVDVSAVYTRHGALALTAIAGFRLDRSTETVDAAGLSPADRIGLGYSDANAALIGIGVARRSGGWTWLGEVSGELLVGAGAPAMTDSPWRIGLGARRALDRSFSLEALAELGGSGRPDLTAMPPDQLVAIEPRAAITVGLSWRPAPPTTKPMILAPPPPPPPLPPPPPPAPTVGTITGKVLDDTGSPLPDATITLGATTITTGDDGGFVIPDLAAGAVELTVERGGYQPATQAITVVAGADAPVTVTLVRIKPPSQIKGLIRDFGGKGLVAKIHVDPLGLDVESSADGTFAIDVPPGSYKVTVTLSGFRTQSKTIVVQDSGVLVWNVDLQKGRR